MGSKNRSVLLTALLLFVLAWFPVFHHLDFLPLYNYDEARRAVNALEMTQTDNMWVTTFRGEPDLWGTKPPLLTWVQAFSIQLFGPNELAIRLPSALAGLCTIFLLFGFVWRYSASLWWAFLSGLALICFKGYCDYHGVRTGDYDALLTFFTTAFLLSLFLSFRAEKKGKWLVLSALFLLLASLTKGIVVFLFGPAILLYLLSEKRLKQIALNYQYYLAIGLAMAGFIAYYYIREQQAPGYWEAVQANELGGRFGQTLEQHQQPFWHYLDVLLESFLFLWAPVAFLLAGRNESERTRSLLRYSGILALVFWLILSMAQTKIRWYILPAMPLLSILIGYSLWQLKNIIKVSRSDSPIASLAGIAAIIAICFLPYSQVIDQIFLKKDFRYAWDEMKFGWFMKRFAEDHPRFSVVRDGYNASIDFYAASLPMLGDVQINARYDGDYGIGEQLLFCTEGAFEKMASQYEFQVQEDDSGCRLVKIKGVKD